MIKFTGISFAPNFTSRMKDNFKKAQKFVDSETLRLCAPYTPRREGDMIKSGISGTVIGSGVVEYTAPYAKRQYYTNAGRGKQGLTKRNAHNYKCLRGKEWLERMKADHLDELERKVKEKFT